MKTNKFLWAFTLVLATGLCWTIPLRSEEAPEEAPPPVDQVAEEGPGDLPPAADAGNPTAAPSEPQVQYNPDGEDVPAPAPKVTPGKKVRAKTAAPAKAQPKVAEEEAQPAVAEQYASSAPEENNKRDESIFDRVKALVKRFDAQQRKGLEYPSSVVETAIRAEFMRRTEGGTGPSWMKKRVREADKEMALDNLEMLLTYAEKLAWAGKKSGKDDAKAVLEAKILASKAVVDKYNYRRGSEGVNNHTAFSPTTGLSVAGKVELGRRRTLGAGLVAGDDYAPVTSKKYDEFAKKYRQALTLSVVDYEKLARLIGGGGTAVPKAHVAATKEKKVERKIASKKPAPEKPTKKKKRRRSDEE